MNVQHAILIELFAILLVLFSGIAVLSDVMYNFQWVMLIGMLLGGLGVIVGFLSGTSNQ